MSRGLNLNHKSLMYGISFQRHPCYSKFLGGTHVVMWIWRRMLGVSWKEKRTNASILSELEVKKGIAGKDNDSKTGLLWSHNERQWQPTHSIVEGMVEGKRKRGRLKKSWFDNIKEWTGLSYMRAKRSAQNRSAWRRTIKKCAEGGRQSSGVTAAAR